MESEYKAIKLRTLWTWIFFNVMLVMERSDSKKLSTKRSVTLIQRQDYSASYESKNLEYLESSSQYDADFPENLRLKAAEELLVMFGLKVGDTRYTISKTKKMQLYSHFLLHKPLNFSLKLAVLKFS